MTETKLELHERLRREGRWDEAQRFKETARQNFRDKGLGRKESNAAAWEAMAAAYPPLPVVEEPEASLPAAGPSVEPGAGRRGQNGHGARVAPTIPDEEIDVEAILERTGDQPPDLARDTLWTYENLPNSKAKPENAPSLGAWSLLCWARQYKNRFFEQILPKAMAAHDSEEEVDQREERKSIAEIQGILDRMEEGWAEELAADVPGTIRKRVQAVVSDWARRYKVDLDDDVRTGLQAHTARLVQDTVEAVAPPSGV